MAAVPQVSIAAAGALQMSRHHRWLPHAPHTPRRASLPQHRRAQRVHGADGGGVLRLPPQHARPHRHAHPGGWVPQPRGGEATAGPATRGGPAPTPHPASAAHAHHRPEDRCAHPSPSFHQDKESGGLVTFCTGVRAGDTLMPMWCGTDYDNEKSRSCSSYFNMLYEVLRCGQDAALCRAPAVPAASSVAALGTAKDSSRSGHSGDAVRCSSDARPAAQAFPLPLHCPPPFLSRAQYVKVGIADPEINWVDLGASRRSAKTAIGFTGHPVRCVGPLEGSERKCSVSMPRVCIWARRGRGPQRGMAADGLVLRVASGERQGCGPLT